MKLKNFNCTNNTLSYAKTLKFINISIYFWYYNKLAKGAREE